MAENSPFKVEKDGFVTWFTLNRPEKRNTMNTAFFEGMIEHFQKLDEDPETRVIIIKAEGKSFCAGLDLAEAGGALSGEGADGRENLRKDILRLQESASILEKCRKPIIAAVHSHCIGGGIDLTSACDIRIASEDAVFSIREVRIGIVADLGTLQRLPYIIGHGWSRELALTGRDFTAKEALEMGYVTHLCENQESLYKKAKDIADEIAANPPLTVQGTKDVILFSRDKGIYPGLEYVAQKNSALIPSEDMLEAFSAFMEKRRPEFKGR